MFNNLSVKNKFNCNLFLFFLVDKKIIIIKINKYLRKQSKVCTLLAVENLYICILRLTIK